ncbi:MAG: outer membrane protein transport protein [Rubrivivax sp.]|nr:outer membrane protein transport protein [Rubrivivax sp.]
MSIRFAHTRMACAIATFALTLGAAPAGAAGFLLNETSASGLGSAFAGGAASAEDASTLWSNVAGLSRIRSGQGIAVLHLIKPSMKFGNGASVAASQQALGGNGGDAGSLAPVPNMYFATPINSQWSAGIGITAPWGLVTEYDEGWVGRFQAIRSSIQTLNVNPGVSWKPARGFALGLGLNFQRMLAEFTNQVNYSAALLNAAALNGIAPGSATFNAIAQATPGLESSARIKGSDNAWGWNAGLLWDISPDHRVGLHYRSALKYHIKGSAQFTNPVPAAPAPLAATVAALAAGVNAVALFDSGVTSDVEIPPIVNLSLFSALGSHWDVMIDAQWTGWSTIKTLTFVRSDGRVLQSTPEHFENSWKVAAGAHYRPGGAWLLRGGVAFDQSPVQTAFRTPRLPDADRTWLTLGGQYRFSNAMAFDVGAAYIWVKKATINASGDPPSTAAYGLLNGEYKSNTMILSAQLNYAF